MRTRRVLLAAVVIVGAVALLPRCGASGPRREYTAPDESLAAAIGLRATDLPPDWRPDPSIGKNDVPRHCYDGIWKHLVITGEAATGFFEGPREFSSGPNYASSHVLVFASRGTAISALIRLRKAPAIRCLADDLKSRLLESTSFRRVNIRPLAFPALDEHSTATRLAIDFPAFGSTARGYVDVVVDQHGPVFVLLLFGNIGHPFDPALERQLARAVAARS